jgi:hypothetical protein
MAGTEQRRRICPSVLDTNYSGGTQVKKLVPKSRKISND